MAANTPRLGLSILANNSNNDHNDHNDHNPYKTRDPLANCSHFRDVLNTIRHTAGPTSIFDVPIVGECALTSSDDPLVHGYTKIYNRADGRIERVSNTLDRTLSYICTLGNQNSHIADLKQYSKDPGNYKAFSETFYPLMPKHIVRVHSAHMCFFPTDPADSLPHSHVIMDKVEGIMLHKFIKEAGSLNKGLMACIMQAICILIKVAQHGWIHNDATVGNFMVVPCSEPITFENVLPLLGAAGEGAGASVEFVDRTIDTYFPPGTPRVVLIDYGDSTKISESPIFPLEAQTFARSALHDVLGLVTHINELTGTFKVMPPYFRWPLAPEHIADVATLKQTSQDGLFNLLMLFSTSPARSGGKRTRKRTKRDGSSSSRRRVAKKHSK